MIIEYAKKKFLTVFNNHNLSCRLYWYAETCMSDGREGKANECRRTSEILQVQFQTTAIKQILEYSHTSFLISQSI